MKKILILTILIGFSPLSFGFEFSEGTYSCQGTDLDRQGTATFQVTKLNLSSSKSLTAFYVDAVYQGGTPTEKDAYGLKGIGNVLTTATGQTRLSIGNNYPTLTLTAEGDQLYAIVGVMKMTCRYTR